MKKMSQSFIPGVVLALICVPQLLAQTPGGAPADTNPAVNATETGQAPGDVMKRLSELVRAGKYAQADQLTAALLLAFPGDQRLIKAKALLDKKLVTAAKEVLSPPAVDSASATPAGPVRDAHSSAPMNNPVPVAVDPPPVPNTVILHLYRPHRLMAAVQKPDVYIDGIKITKIENSQVIQMVLAPGRHTISVSKRGVESVVPLNNLDMSAGQEYWVRVELSAGAWGAHSKLFVVPSEQALPESSRLEEIKLGHVARN